MIPFVSESPVAVTGSKVKARPARQDGGDPGSFRSIYVVPAGGTLGKKDALELHLPDALDIPENGSVIDVRVEAYVDPVALTNRETGEPFVGRRTKYRVVSYEYATVELAA